MWYIYFIYFWLVIFVGAFYFNVLIISKILYVTKRIFHIVCLNTLLYSLRFQLRGGGIRPGRDVWQHCSAKV